MKRPLIRHLDARPVGERVGEGDAQLDDVGPARGDGEDDIGGALRQRVAGGGKGDQGFLVPRLEVGEGFCDAAQGWFLLVPILR
jgi:hypothetical protein